MKLYVGNLDYKVKESDLMKMFEKYGVIDSATVITDKYSGRSKGFGFVTIEDQESALRAIKELNGVLQGERNIIVTEARPKKNNSY